MDLQPMFFKYCTACNTDTVWTVMESVHDKTKVECDVCENVELMPNTIVADAL